MFSCFTGFCAFTSICCFSAYAQLCGLVSEGPAECGIAPGRYVQIADPEVRWFVLGDETLKPKNNAAPDFASNTAPSVKVQPFTIALLMIGSAVAKNNLYTEFM